MVASFIPIYRVEKWSSAGSCGRLYICHDETRESGSYVCYFEGNFIIAE